MNITKFYFFFIFNFNFKKLNSIVKRLLNFFKKNYLQKATYEISNKYSFILNQDFEFELEYGVIFNLLANILFYISIPIQIKSSEYQKKIKKMK